MLQSIQLVDRTTGGREKQGGVAWGRGEGRVFQGRRAYGPQGWLRREHGLGGWGEYLCRKRLPDLIEVAPVCSQREAVQASSEALSKVTGGVGIRSLDGIGGCQ
jgi:hypothetical protein